MKIDLEGNEIGYLIGLIEELLTYDLKKLPENKKDLISIIECSREKGKIIQQRLLKYMPKNFLKKHGTALAQIAELQKVPIEQVKYLIKRMMYLKEPAV